MNYNERDFDKFLKQNKPSVPDASLYELNMILKKVEKNKKLFFWKLSGALLGFSVLFIAVLPIIKNNESSTDTQKIVKEEEIAEFVFDSYKVVLNDAVNE